MNPLRHSALPVSQPQETAPSFEWDSALIRALLTENSGDGARPSLLILGKRETRMLRRHLGNAFGPEAVQCLKNTYYMGLQVVEDPSESLLCVAGRKATGSSAAVTKPSFPDALGPNPRWRFSA